MWVGSSRSPTVVPPTPVTEEHAATARPAVYQDSAGAQEEAYELKLAHDGLLAQQQAGRRSRGDDDGINAPVDEVAEVDEASVLSAPPGAVDSDPVDELMLLVGAPVGFVVMALGVRILVRRL